MKSLAIGLFAINLVAQQVPYTITQTIAYPVTQATTTVVGTPGTGVYHYWIIANSRIGPSTAYRITARFVPNVLSGSNFVRISWTGVSSATSYDILKTSTDTLPTTTSNIALATGIGSAQVSDTGQGLGAYTVSQAANPQYNASFNMGLTAPIINTIYTPNDGSTSTVDATVAAANAALTTGTAMTVKFGVGTYHTCTAFTPKAFANSQSTLHFEGPGKDVANIILDCPLAVGVGVIDNNATAVTKSITESIKGLTIDANKNADIGISLTNLCCNSKLDDIGIRNVRSGGFAGLKITNSYQVYPRDVEYDGRGRGGAYGAQIIPQVTSGQVTSYVIGIGVVTVPVSAGGTGYTVAPTVTFTGTCLVQPVATVNLSGNSVGSITTVTQGVCLPGLTASLTGGNGSGATLGTLSTVLWNGLNYDANTIPTLRGFGAGTTPCATMPTSQPVITLGAGGTIASVAPASNDVAGMGSGCIVGQGIYLTLYDGDNVTWGFYFNNVTDSNATNLVTNVGSTAGIYHNGAMNFNHYHVIDSPPIQFYQDGGDTTHINPEFDSIVGYGIYVNTPGKVTIVGSETYWDTKDTYPAASLAFLGANSFGATFISGQCGALNPGGDYHHTVTAFAGSNATGGPWETGQGGLPLINGISYGTLGYYAEVQEGNCVSDTTHRYRNYMAASNLSVLQQGPLGLATSTTNFRFQPANFCNSVWNGSTAHQECWQIAGNTTPSGTVGFENLQISSPSNTPAATVQFQLINPNLATSSFNIKPLDIQTRGSCWNGSAAITESFTWQATYTGTANATWDYKLNHAGCNTATTNTITIPFTMNIGTVNVNAIKSTTGTRYVCVDSTGTFTSSATACSGT